MATLVVIDDLTYGPVFWVLSIVGPTPIVVGFAFGIYWLVQMFLVREGLKSQPGRAARFFLERLQLERKNAEIGHREQTLHRKVTTAVVALPLSLVIGGVLPPLILARNGVARTTARRLAVVTSGLYAAEFAYLHAYLPSRVF